VGPDPQKWPEDDILYMLAHFGHDTAGNYIIGEPAYRRHLEAMQQGLATTSEAGYPALATAAMQAGDAGSSAGGEFPKFTAFREHAGHRAHVIVKFSGNDHTPGVQRWSDLLVCEHLALEAVATELGLPARGAASAARTIAPSWKWSASTVTESSAVPPFVPGPRWMPPCSAWRARTGAAPPHACCRTVTSAPIRSGASTACGILVA
jgi:hypothetical protein